MRILLLLCGAASATAIPSFSSNDPTSSPANTSLHNRATIKDKAAAVFAVQGIEQEQYAERFTALVGDMANCMRRPGDLMPSDCAKFDEPRHLWGQIRLKFETGERDLRVDQYHEAVNKSVLATTAVKQAHARDGNSTQKQAFETFATHMILVGEIYQLSPYTDMPSYIFGPPQDLLRSLVDLSGIDVRKHHWEATWKGMMI